jgi:hypothetical protein
MRAGIVIAATGQKQSGRNRNQEGRFHIGNLAQPGKIPNGNCHPGQWHPSPPHPQKMRRATPAKSSKKSYGAGALVVAGAFVDGISGVVAGGVDVSACFWQPVNSPTPTNPNTAANNNIFFMGI